MDVEFEKKKLPLKVNKPMRKIKRLTAIYFPPYISKSAFWHCFQDKHIIYFTTYKYIE